MIIITIHSLMGITIQSDFSLICLIDPTYDLEHLDNIGLLVRVNS